MKEAREKNIADMLVQHNEETHLRGETLPEQQQVYRIKVVTAFLKAGVPLSKIESFRELLEENAYRLTDRRNMHDYVPFILKDEENRIRQEIDGKQLSIIFDGTSRLGEALAIVVRFVNDDLSIHQRLVRLQMLTKSLTGEEIARELITALSVSYSIHPSNLLGAMRDRASTNNVAMRTLMIVYPKVVDVGCFSHTIDHVGGYFKTPVLTDFTSLWISLFSHSPKTRLLWKTRTDRSMKSYSSTRWWSKWEVMQQMFLYFGDIAPFLDENEDIGPALRPKLLEVLRNPQKCAYLHIELAAVVDWGEPFVKACYFLEGDGPLAVDCYEAVDRILAGLRTEHIPNVRAIAQLISGKPPADPSHEAWISYARSCVQPGLDYFKRQLASTTGLKLSMEIFKGCRLFSPQKIHIMQTNALAIDEALSTVPFLNTKQELDGLKAELPAYLAKAADTDQQFNILEWWKLNAPELPKWSAAARKVFLIQPSSAASERVFSLLKNSFGAQQDNALKDYVEASLMLQFNKR